MKTKHQAVRSLTTQQLKDLADMRYLRPPDEAARTRRRPSPPLSAAPIWELKGRADALQQTPGIQGFTTTPPPARRKGLVQKTVSWLLGAESEEKRRKAARQATPPAAPGSGGAAPSARRPAAGPRAPDDDIHWHVRQAVGETILGNVTLKDVLKEMERRGVKYAPPVVDGVLNVDDHDLLPAKDGQPAKLRPGLAKYLKDHQDELAGIRVNGTRPVGLGQVRMPQGFVESVAPVQADCLEVKQLHCVGDVTVEEYVHAAEIRTRGDVSAREIVTAECTVRGNVDCHETLKFTAGSSGSKQTVTGNVQCGRLVSEDDRPVNVAGKLAVKGNCSVARLSAKDLSVGWELQNVKALSVTGKVNIARLASQLDAQAEFQGVALQERVQQLRDARQGQGEQTAPENARAAIKDGRTPDQGKGQNGASPRRYGRNGAGADGSALGRSR